MKLWLTDFSIRFPRLLLLLVVLLTALFAAQFPKVRFDNDPENMLAADEPVRLFHHQVKERFALYDFVIVGVVNETDPDGVFNVDSLQRIHALSAELYSLQRSADGLPTVIRPAHGEQPEQRLEIDLSPSGRWQQLLATAFNHNPNQLFSDLGESAIIAREIISPSLVDSLQQAELGALRLDYLMEQPPEDRQQALKIRDLALNNPLYRGTLAAEDGKALALYLPIRSKTFSYNVANLVRELTADWPQQDQVHITGLPVAEDTFGVEMLVQMATSAPLAMLAIFLLLLLFFRRVSIIIAPMIVAVISIICTMGLLIGLGFEVHIMSSMIAIFLMPIAVADAVHILSEFHDSYHRFGDRVATLRHVIGHLFLPMLYTSLTTIAGFASLSFTPIPPVQIFGLHVAFGVALAWLLTMTLVPAYIIVAIPQSALDRLGSSARQEQVSVLGRSLAVLGRFSARRWKPILTLGLLLLLLAAWGISMIKVNDNPVKWFGKKHQIRVADRVLNQHFGGTYTAYLILEADGNPAADSRALLTLAEARLQQRLAAALPAASARFNARLAALEATASPAGNLQQLRQLATVLDQQGSEPWRQLAEELNYLELEPFNRRTLGLALKQNPQLDQTLVRQLLLTLPAEQQGEELRDSALDLAEQRSALSFSLLVEELQAELAAPPFKQPVLLAWLRGLQEHLASMPVVGKSSSPVDALQKANYELLFQPTASETANLANFGIPTSAAGTGQVFTQLEGMKKKDSLFHLVTRDYRQVNLWVQLTSGDNQDMEQVVDGVARYLEQHPPPLSLKAEWAGLTYINVVWQDKMMRGMLASLGSSFLVVLGMMIFLFRSFWFGLLAMIPLSVTISLIYGLIGFIGKDYDMPVAILSAMTLGLSVDFAIHFLQRARELSRNPGGWETARSEMFKEPALAISRNAIIISVGFTPLLLAPLVPYNTVGFFLATIMAVSWLATLFILSALLTALAGRLLNRSSASEVPHD